MSRPVVFMDRQGTILSVLSARWMLARLVPSFTGNFVKRGQLFRIGGRVYRPIQVSLGHAAVNVTVDELLPHQAIPYVLKCQRSAGGE